MSEEFDFLETLLDNRRNRSWEYNEEPAKPCVIDQKFPKPVSRSFSENLGNVYNDMPTFQIEMLLDWIRNNPNPAIISEMKSTLVMAKLMYKGEEIKYKQDMFNDRKKEIIKKYNKELETYNKHKTEALSGDTHIRRTFKALLDKLHSYNISDFNKERVCAISKLLSIMKVDHDYIVTEEDFGIMLGILKSSNAYKLLEHNDKELWYFINLINDSICFLGEDFYDLRKLMRMVKRYS